MERYVWKEIPGSSHEVLRRRICALAPGLRLLDIGAAGGHLGRSVRDRCAYLAGVEPLPDTSLSGREGYDDWRTTDAVDAGEWATPFDVVVCGDVLEHLPRPEQLLERIRVWLKPGGLLITSIPNVANIYVRLSLLSGQFPYAERGILDETHLRFYTLSSARRLLEQAGFEVRAVEPTAIPYELAIPALSRGLFRKPVRGFAHASARFWPKLLGYQFVFEAIKK